MENHHFDGCIIIRTEFYVDDGIDPLVTFSAGVSILQNPNESMQVVGMDTKDLRGLGVIVSCAIKCIQHEPALRLQDSLVVLSQLTACHWLPLQ